ncbi:MAG: phosphopantothenate/pantothenate synthetase [Methanomassiliicoccaceae archaeon]|nr:phosphopantothenate/pantothenate synthetase [Methanomassiliicoccaceae archaeon]
MYPDRASEPVDIPKDHPRYSSLMVRERLTELMMKGLVTPTGLISHGRGEAFDYLMNESTTQAALDAQRAAVAYLFNARNPVICVNGNAAALDAQRIIELSLETGSKIEVNIFHRTEERMGSLIEYMESCGAKNVLGRNPDSRIPGLSSYRALCTNEGIYSSDVILVPIEDGDRAEALVSMGKVVISVDLNPLSRTSRAATVSISDELSRALANMLRFAKELKNNEKEKKRILAKFSNSDNRKAAIDQICENLRSAAEDQKVGR